MTETIRCYSSELRSTSEQWLQTEVRDGTRLVVLEGHLQSGKSTLTNIPFKLNARQSVNFPIDDFRPQPVSQSPYLETIDRDTFERKLRGALPSAPIVIVQGAIAWPLVEPLIQTLGGMCVRRAYLKRMMRNNPDSWMDEKFILGNEWPSFEPSRSIYQYQFEQRPWEHADLILERVEEQ